MVISKKKFPLKHAELFTVTFGYHYDIKSFGDLFKRNNFIEVNHIHIDPYKRAIWDLPTLVDNFPYQKVNFKKKNLKTHGKTSIFKPFPGFGYFFHVRKC